MQRACEQHNGEFKFLYPLNLSIKEKIAAIVASYGADGVEYSPEVRALSHPNNSVIVNLKHASMTLHDFMFPFYTLHIYV